jgi:hypothetical protein
MNSFKNAQEVFMRKEGKNYAVFAIACMFMVAAISMLFTGCGKPTEAPAGTKIKAPDATAVKSNYDVIMITSWTITNANGDPLNSIDAECTIVNGIFVTESGTPLDYTGTLKVRSDDRGLIKLYVGISGSIEGEVLVVVSVGVATGTLTITKSRVTSGS